VATNLDRLPTRRPEGIFVNPFERGEIAPLVERNWKVWYRSGGIGFIRQVGPRTGSRKNRTHPALDRVMELRTT
jgi:bifunctional non-homologous end joining protein LigD